MSRVSAATSMMGEKAPQIPLCPVPAADEGLLFWEIWDGPNPPPNSRWDAQKRAWDNGWIGQWQGTVGDWIDPTPGEAGTMRQNSQVMNQANIAYELETDIEDGVILGCMQLRETPAGNTPFPHGILFRMHDLDNFYGVGFLDDSTLVLDKLVNGVPIPLQTAAGFTSTEINRFRIVLSQDNVQVFVAPLSQDFPDTSTLAVTDPALAAPPFQVGKIGLGTYEVQADFGAITVATGQHDIFLPLTVKP